MCKRIFLILIVLLLLLATIGNLQNSGSLNIPIQVAHIIQLNNSEISPFIPIPVHSNIPKPFIPHITPNLSMQGITYQNIIVYNTILQDSVDPTITEIRVVPYDVNISINNSVYYGALDAVKNTYLVLDLSLEQNYFISYNAYVDDPHQEELYDNILTSLRKYRNLHNLNDDEYLEFITRFVQSIPNKDRNYHRFPIETIFEDNGVCEDKSFLLAGLLEREGYDVGLFTFSNINPQLPGHMVVGVKSSGLRYNGTQYTLIETTMTSSQYNHQYHYVGLVDLSEFNPNPIFTKIGDGTKQYSASDEVTFINDSVDTCLFRIKNHIIIGNSNPCPSNIAEILNIIGLGIPDRESVYIWLSRYENSQIIPENITVLLNSSDFVPYYKLL